MLKFDQARTLYLGKNALSTSLVQTSSLGAAPIPGHRFTPSQLLPKWPLNQRATCVPGVPNPASSAGSEEAQEGACSQVSSILCGLCQVCAMLDFVLGDLHHFSPVP